MVLSVLRWGLAALTLLGAALATDRAIAAARDLKVQGKTPAEFVASQTGKSWAVVIGIDQYEKAPRLKYAVADAQSVADTLRQRGFEVATLYDAQATRRGILGALGDKLVKKVSPADRVVIFYAGHGETQQAEGGRAMGYLLPVNGEGDALAETAISMGLIRELSDALPAKQVLFVVDVCYGGIAGQQFRSLPPLTEAYLKTITRERGRQLITAGGPKQQAMEAPEWGHSVFTYYLLEGLNRGLADLNDDGIIPASELYAYLNERVFSAAHLKGHEQRPELWSLAAEKGEFVFFATTRSTATGPTPAPGPEDVAAHELAVLRQEMEKMRKELEAERQKQHDTRSQEERIRVLEDMIRKEREIPPPAEDSAPAPRPADFSGWWAGTGSLQNRWYYFDQQGHVVTFQEVMQNTWGLQQVMAQGYGQITGQGLLIDYVATDYSRWHVEGQLSPDGQVLNVRITNPLNPYYAASGMLYRYQRQPDVFP